MGNLGTVKEGSTIDASIHRLRENLKCFASIAVDLESIGNRLVDTSSQKVCNSEEPRVDYDKGHLGEIRKLIDDQEAIISHLNSQITKLNNAV